MRVFVAGATGAIGRLLLPILVEAGHEVAGMTRSEAKVAQIEAAGATAVVCDAYDPNALLRAVVAFKPDVVLHQLTDLPRTAAALPLKVLANNRARIKGTDNIVAAARAAGARVVAQSIAFDVPAIARKGPKHLEKAVLAEGGVVLRYGYFWGPGTWYDAAGDDGEWVHVETAARRTVELLDADTGVHVITD